jgi:flagellar motility protein MotE (MotC chaperone)
VKELGRLRLLPVAIAALAALGILKIAGLALNGGYALSPVSIAVAQDAAEDANTAAGETPSPALPAANAGNAAGVAPAAATAEGGGASEGAPAPLSESERAVLESLRQRRQELEQRESGLLMRENLLKAAEQRVDAKVAELKAMERRIQASIRDKEEADDQQFAGLVSMYETMKAKAAAQIFNRLDTNVVVGVARRMNPEALAGVLARMDPAVAERVTVELAQISERNTGLVNELDAIEPQ